MPVCPHSGSDGSFRLPDPPSRSPFVSNHTFIGVSNSIWRLEQHRRRRHGLFRPVYLCCGLFRVCAACLLWNRTGSGSQCIQPFPVALDVPRTVNLSGQRRTSGSSPYGAVSPFGAASPFGASQSVSLAQAERRQRQQERDRLAAVQLLQRLWRGHTARRNLRHSRRSAYDQLIQLPDEQLPDGGLVGTRTAVNLLVYFYEARYPDDMHRLLALVKRYEASSVSVRHLGPVLSQLGLMMVDALEAQISGYENQGRHLSEALLDSLARLQTEAYWTLQNCLARYYKVVYNFCRRDGPRSQLLAKAVLAPMLPPRETAFTSAPGQVEVMEAFLKDCERFTDQAYVTFSFLILTESDLFYLEPYLDAILSGLDINRFASLLASGPVRIGLASTPAGQRFNLLAHFIQWMDSRPIEPGHYPVLAALSMQLSALVHHTRFWLPLSGPDDDREEMVDAGESSSQAMGSPSPYVKDKLVSLLQPNRVSKLLATFSITPATLRMGEGLWLAEFTLTLLQCFPAYGDELRILFFTTRYDNSGHEINVIKSLWQSVRQTGLFGHVLRDPNAPMAVLSRYFRSAEATITAPTEAEMTEDREWVQILLFLDLYTLLLRLSDDEDFLSGMDPHLTGSELATTRLRSCSLSRPDVTDLSLFLKALCFPLYYKPGKILMDAQSYRSSVVPVVVPVVESGSVLYDGSVGRLDYGSLRVIISNATRMLYERDSRRQFLPAKHWLMESAFSMEGFVEAVVAEEQRQLELEADADGEAEDNAAILQAQRGLGRGRPAGISNRAAILMWQQNWMRREMRLAQIGPKLEVLRKMPYVIPFETRVQMFRRFVLNDKIRRRNGDPDAHLWRVVHHADPVYRAQIRRQSVFDDAYRQLWRLGDKLKEPIQITFIDQFSAQEMGIDGGGVTKEFLTSVMTEAFGQRTGITLFVSNEAGSVYPNPCALDAQLYSLQPMMAAGTARPVVQEMVDLLQRYEFLGRIVGKCLYEGILVDVAFAPFFLLKWTTTTAMAPTATTTTTGTAAGTVGAPSAEKVYRGSVNDLRDMDEAVYQGLLQLKNYEGDVAELGLNFTIDDQVSLPDENMRTISRLLMPDGDRTAVTNDNRLLYMSYVAKHRLVIQPARQTAHFLRGLRTIIQPQWLAMFNQAELQRLVGGDSQAIDLLDLRRNTVCAGLYDPSTGMGEHNTIRHFWDVMVGFSDPERRAVVKYVTSTPRAPLLGFSQLQPRFTIRDAGTDDGRLPSASTCVNLLKLPMYQTKELLRQKLLLAITSGAGFDLS